MVMTEVAVSPRVRPGERSAGAPIVLGRRGSLWVSAGVVAHTLWTSAAPAMAYRLYANEWHLSHTVTAGIFAIYPIVVVAVLIGFGDISDHLGRRVAMLMGLGASLAGTLLFAIAPSVDWLFVARALMGVGVGLTAGPSTAAVLEFARGGAPKRAALITTMAQASGFATALLLGGALVQYAPWPTRLSFWVLAALLALLFAAAWFLPRHIGAETDGRWRPRGAVYSEGNARYFYTCIARNDDCLHAWRARAVAGRTGCPRSCRYVECFRWRRCSVAVRDRVRR